MRGVLAIWARRLQVHPLCLERDGDPQVWWDGGQQGFPMQGVM